MPDVANLVLGIDSTQVPKGTAALNELASAGARAEAATVGLGGGFKGAGAEAAAMASAAQASARAVMGQAAGFGAATEAARINTMAMRESLVVARELSRGNFTRLPGSLTLLAQGIGSQGGVSAFVSSLTRTLGLVKTLQDAELAEEAVAAAAAASSVEGAARRAAANVMTADTEVALAEAAVRNAEGATAEAAAQVRLAAATQGVAAASAEAAIAQDALGVAMARSMETGAASAAATVTTVSTLGAALGVSAIAAGLAGAAFKEVKDAADAIDPSAKRFIDTLGLTKAEINKLKDTTVTWGDVVHGTFDAVAEAAGTSSSQFKSFWGEAFLEVAQVGVSAAQVIAGAFAAVGSIAKDLQNVGLAAVAPGMQGILAQQGAVPGIGQIGQDALNAFEKQFSATGNFFHRTLPNDVNRSRDSRLRNQANKLIDRRIPKKPKKGPKQAVDHAYDTSARLDEQILSARLKLAGTVQEQVSLQLQQIDVEKNKTVADAQQLLASHKITAGEEKHIELQASQLADLKAQAIIREGQTKLLTEQQAAQDQLLGFQTDALKAADQMATTAADHRAIQLQMLDIAMKQQAVDLQILLSKQKIAGDLQGQALTQGKIDHLPTSAYQQAQAINDNTKDPLQKWMAQVPHDASMITEALQGIETKGFDSLAQGIAGVVTGTESLGHVFKDVANSIVSDIVQMTVKMLVFKAISGVFGGGGFDQNSFGATVASNNAWASSALAAAPHFANGGSMIIGGNGGVDKNVLSLNGSPVAMVGQGETLAVYPNTPQAANSNQRQVIEVHVVTDENFGANVQQIAGQTVINAAPQIIATAAKTTVSALTRRSLNGGR